MIQEVTVCKIFKSAPSLKFSSVFFAPTPIIRDNVFFQFQKSPPSIQGNLGREIISEETDTSSYEFLSFYLYHENLNVIGLKIYTFYGIIIFKKNLILLKKSEKKIFDKNLSSFCNKFSSAFLSPPFTSFWFFLMVSQWKIFHPSWLTVNLSEF